MRTDVCIHCGQPIVEPRYWHAGGYWCKPCALRGYDGDPQPSPAPRVATNDKEQNMENTRAKP